jgi:hypothetical protein
MKMKFLFHTLAAVITISCLCSCDGGGDGSSDVPFLSADGETDPPTTDPDSPRYPSDLNPADLAVFPEILITSPRDQFVLSPSVFDISEIPFPTTDGENEGVILPFAATTVVSDSQTYDYKLRDGIGAALLLSGTTRGANAPLSYLDGLVDLAGFAGPNATQRDTFFDNVNDALRDLGNDANNRPTNAVVRAIIQIEVDLINDTQTPNFIADTDVGEKLLVLVGYLGVSTPVSGGDIGFLIEFNQTGQQWTLEEVRVPVADLIVLRQRLITLENPTSNNQTLLDDLEITGDYLIEDVYTRVFFSATSEEGGFVATDSPDSGSNFAVPGSASSVQSEAQGTYTYKLGSLFNSN